MKPLSAEPWNGCAGPKDQQARSPNQKPHFPAFSYFVCSVLLSVKILFSCEDFPE